MLGGGVVRITVRAMRAGVPVLGAPRSVRSLLALVVGLLCVAAPRPRTTTPAVVRVGTEGVYPPFTFHDQDTHEFTGFDVDVMRAIGEAGWDVQFVEAPFDSLFPRWTRSGST